MSETCDKLVIIAHRVNVRESFNETQRKLKVKKTILVLAFLFAFLHVCSGQHIGRLYIPHSMCAGDTFTVTFGYDLSNNVVLERQQHMLGVVERVFLPDGVPCGNMGCSYQSTVTFDDFDDDSVITTEQAIKYLRLNLEHSFIGDLYISLKCPNGQKATVMRFGGNLTSQCGDSIPQSGQGWLSGSNMSTDRDFGIVGGANADPPCDSTVDGNQAGTGWDYCWSNNTVSGYSYASGDGILYRTGHSHNGIVDASNVAQGSNFYHPDQNFSALIGCPLNGNWTIEIIDGFSHDNGYLFEWDISLDGNLMPNQECVIDSFSIESYCVTRIGDSSFFIAPPLNLEHDTTVTYYFQAFDNCGHMFDTMTTITFRALERDNDTVEIVENQLPYQYRGVTFEDSVSLFPMVFDNDPYCDSLVNFTLIVWRNEYTTVDTIVCEDQLPVEWHGETFQTAGSFDVVLQTVHGADSVVTYRLDVQRYDTTHVNVSLCAGVEYTWIDGETYSSFSDQPVYVMSGSGACDSVLKLHLHPSNEQYELRLDVYPNPVPIDNSRVVLNDNSASVSRRWSYLDCIDTARYTSFLFPFPADSTEVFFYGRDAAGCSDSTHVTVFSDMSSFFAPNVFTPEEQSNNRFFIASNQILEGSVSIFTRAGQLVTTFDLLTGSWDGTFQGRPCPQGTYVWRLTYVRKSMPEVEQVAVGTVTLLR